MERQLDEGSGPEMLGAHSRQRDANRIGFQDHAGDPIHEYLRLGGDPRRVLDTLNRLYRESLTA